MIVYTLGPAASLANAGLCRSSASPRTRSSFPKGDRFRQAVRDVELFRDWHYRGIVPDDLASRYKISTQHVYRIIREQRGLYMREVQPDLFLK